MKLCISIIVVFFTLSVLQAQDVPRPNNARRLKTFHCNGKAINLTPRLNTSIKICREKMKLNHPPHPVPTLKSHPTEHLKSHNRSLCQLICPLQNLKLVDDSGVLIEEEIESLVKEHLPTLEANEFIKKGRECIQEFGNIIPISGDNCSVFGKLIQCAVIAFSEVCRKEINGTSFDSQISV